jgi:mono/diheme cytochrome c family protein
MTRRNAAFTPLRLVALLGLGLLVGSCGGSAPDDGAADAQPDAAAAPGGLTAEEMEQGIGPIRNMDLGPVDPDLAAIGEEAFATKCSACHKLEERYVGPQLGSVLSHRRPEFVMNMILNANEMVQRHPEVQALLAQYYTPMPVQVTDQEEARAILEYLRSNQTEAESTTSGSTGGP